MPLLLPGNCISKPAFFTGGVSSLEAICSEELEIGIHTELTVYRLNNEGSSYRNCDAASLGEVKQENVDLSTADV